MPLFEYRCQRCGHTFEKVTSSSQSANVSCPACGSESVRKVFSPFASYRGASTGASSCRPSG
ncbi:MAG: FmdB family zinc ribbon protein [Anaerolineae bacterium]